MNQIPTSYLTHELRAPVTAIRLGLELLQEELDAKIGAEERNLLIMAVKNTTRLQNLVNDIMDYAKLTSGKLGLKVRSCDARELAREAAAGIEAWARSKNVNLVVTCEEGLPEAWADPDRVIQVLTNLLSNALKFTPAGGAVRVRVAREEGRDVLRFEVHDSGCGVAKQDLEKIFDAFAQGAEGRKISQGTGLGLTLSRWLVNLLGGRIWAESAPGRGSSFFFTVPLSA